jgi:hypothetical protein
MPKNGQVKISLPCVTSLSFCRITLEFRRFGQFRTKTDNNLFPWNPPADLKRRSFYGRRNCANIEWAENAAGSTPAIVISEPVGGDNLLKIDLGAGRVFAGTSTIAATGLTYQNAGSPTTSQFATVDISLSNAISALVANLAGERITLGPIRNSVGGVGRVEVSAATIEAAGVNTSSVNGNVDLKAAGNLTVALGSTIQSGAGTIVLATDVKSDGLGDDGVGTLSILAGTSVASVTATTHQNLHVPPGRSSV